MNVAIRASARARRLRLTASAERGIVLVVPARTSQRSIDAFLRDQRSWIARQGGRILEQHEAAIGYAHPGTAWLDGGPLPIVVRAGLRARATLTARDVHVTAPDAVRAATALERLYRRLARDRIDRLIATSPLAARITRITIGDQRSRWGSCSRSGALAISWRLVLAPPSVLDYVVVHELCHLVHLDHSPRFWALVGEQRPGWRAQAGWLKQHGWELHAHAPIGDGGASRGDTLESAHSRLTIAANRRP